MALLKPKLTNTKTLSYRLPGELVDAVETVRGQADAAGFVIDVGAAVERALTQLVREARAELNSLPGPASSAGSSTPPEPGHDR